MTSKTSMSHVIVLLLSLSFVALTLGVTFAHVLEIVGKLRLGARDWLTVQQNLYIACGPIGGTCAVLAIVFTWLTVGQRPVGTPEARYTRVAAIAASLGLIAWAVVVAPMNTVLSSWTPQSIPSDWTRVRNRWNLATPCRQCCTRLRSSLWRSLRAARVIRGERFVTALRSSGSSGVVPPTGLFS